MTVCTMRVLSVWQFVPFEELMVSVCVSVQMLWRGERQGLERIQQQVSHLEFLRQGGAAATILHYAQYLLLHSVLR